MLTGCRFRRGCVTREEFLDLLARLRCAPAGRARLRAPHKPLLLLWLFGRFAATGRAAAAYAEAEEPVSTLINDFGPPVAKASAGRQRAAMPFVHLEREIWDLRDGSGAEIGPDAPERGPWLAGHGAVGRLRAAGSGRPVRPAAARAPAGPARRGSQSRRMAPPAGLQGGRRRGRIRTDRVRHRSAATDIKWHP